MKSGRDRHCGGLSRCLRLVEIQFCKNICPGESRGFLLFYWLF
jgi:hypothetical protein